MLAEDALSVRFFSPSYRLFQSTAGLDTISVEEAFLFFNLFPFGNLFDSSYCCHFTLHEPGKPLASGACPCCHSFARSQPLGIPPVELSTPSLFQPRIHSPLYSAPTGTLSRQARDYHFSFPPHEIVQPLFETFIFLLQPRGENKTTLSLSLFATPPRSVLSAIRSHSRIHHPTTWSLLHLLQIWIG